MKSLLILIALAFSLTADGEPPERWFVLPKDIEQKLLMETGGKSVLAIYKIVYVKSDIGEILAIRADLNALFKSPEGLKRGVMNVNVAFVRMQGKEEFYSLSFPVEMVAENGLDNFPEGFARSIKSK